MNFGQLTTNNSRIERPCKANCGETIKKGEAYAGIRYVKVGINKRSFIVRVHKECIIKWMDDQYETKQTAMREKNWEKTPKPGRVSLGLSTDEMKARKKAQYYNYIRKMALQASYSKRDDKLIQYCWVALAEALHNYVSVGGSGEFKIGIHTPVIMENSSPDGFLEALLYAVQVDKEVGKMADVIDKYWNPDGSIVVKHHKYPSTIVYDGSDPLGEYEDA